MSKLVIIRGNSSSGKTVLAENLQRLFHKEAIRISQDMIRREMLAVKDGKDNNTIDLIKELIVYGSINQNVVLVEGIFKREWYIDMFKEVFPFFNGVYCYYYDISFEETVKRYKTKGNTGYTIADMNSWWNEKDALGLRGEELISKDVCLTNATNQIYNKITRELAAGCD